MSLSAASMSVSKDDATDAVAASTASSPATAKDDATVTVSELERSKRSSRASSTTSARAAVAPPMPSRDKKPKLIEDIEKARVEAKKRTDARLQLLDAARQRKDPSIDELQAQQQHPARPSTNTTSAAPAPVMGRRVASDGMDTFQAQTRARQDTPPPVSTPADERHKSDFLKALSKEKAEPKFDRALTATGFRNQPAQGVELVNSSSKWDRFIRLICCHSEKAKEVVKDMPSAAVSSVKARI
jgi:hypothetical protein